MATVTVARLIGIVLERLPPYLKFPALNIPKISASTDEEIDKDVETIASALGTSGTGKFYQPAKNQGREVAAIAFRLPKRMLNAGRMKFISSAVVNWPGTSMTGFRQSVNCKAQEPEMNRCPRFANGQLP